MRIFIAIVLAKAVRLVSRHTGRGKGTSLPGLVAQKVMPNIIAKYGKQLTEGVVLVAGTNGKTTTAKLIKDQLNESGRDVITNSSSANLSTGIASALIESSNVFGRLRAKEAVFEVDEHALVPFLEKLPVKLIVITNLFRDQLDRYGEIDNIVAKWNKNLAKVKDSVNLVVNGNDPRLLLIANNFPGKVNYFGIDQPEIIGKPNLIAADTTRCPHCSGSLQGERFMAHLGVLNCSACNMKMPQLNSVITSYNPSTGKNSSVAIKTDKGEIKTTTQLFGRFNVFNIAASVAASLVLGVTLETISEAIPKTKNVFGRSEVIDLDNKKIFLHLAKNPTGYNEILGSLDEEMRTIDLLLILNDNWADGQDISWIWDVDFESFKNKIASLSVSGQRAGDLGLRLSTAGYQNKIKIEQNPVKAFADIRNNLKGEAHIIASYTAMIFLRKELESKGLTKKVWE